MILQKSFYYTDFLVKTYFVLLLKLKTVAEYFCGILFLGGREGMGFFNE